MQTRKRIVLSVAVLLCVIALLAGCSDPEPSRSDAPLQASESAVETPSTETSSIDSSSVETSSPETSLPEEASSAVSEESTGSATSVSGPGDGIELPDLPLD